MDELVHIPEDCFRLTIARDFNAFKVYYHFKFFLPNDTTSETSVQVHFSQIENVKSQLDKWRLVEDHGDRRVYER